MNVYELLSRDNYLTVNKLVMKKLGISESILLSELCYRRQFLARVGKLTEDGFFYATVEDVEEQTTLSDYSQRKILEKFSQMGLAKVERRGLPAKRYICIYEDALQLLMNSVTSDAAPVPEDFENKSPNSSALNNNNTTNNTHVLSKDNTFGKGRSPGSASSGKLFSSGKPTTRKSSVQKTNAFITACQKAAIEKEFPQEVLKVLDDYFRMLAEMNCLLPVVSIKEQLVYLQKVAPGSQIAVVKGTISHGWKSLQYEAESCISGTVPSWDTAAPDAFQAKTEEQKLRNPLEDVPEDRIF